MCSYPQNNDGKVPCCTHQCEGCVWNERDEDEEDEHDKELRNAWVLSANAVQSITEALQKLFPAPFLGAVEAFEKLEQLALSPRGYRKAIRWDEKNRRRQLKGLPEKPCPYQDRLLKIASANRRYANDKAGNT